MPGFSQARASEFELEEDGENDDDDILVTEAEEELVAIISSQAKVISLPPFLPPSRHRPPHPSPSVNVRLQTRTIDVSTAVKKQLKDEMLMKGMKFGDSSKGVHMSVAVSNGVMLANGTPATVMMAPPTAPPLSLSPSLSCART